MESKRQGERRRTGRVVRVSNVKRPASARRRRIVFWSVVAAAGAAALALFGRQGCAWLRAKASESQVFELTRIEVVCSGTLTSEDILRVADVQKGMNIWEVDVEGVRGRLEDNPLVARATVSRQIPDMLRIDVVERVPEARLTTGGGGTTLTIDREGHVMGPRSVRAALPEITGVSDAALSPGDVVHDEMLPDLMEILDICRGLTNRNGKAEIVPLVLDISDRTRIRMELQGGDELLLSTKGYAEKLRQFPLMRSVGRDRGAGLHHFDMTVDKNYPATP